MEKHSNAARSLVALALALGAGAALAAPRQVTLSGPTMDCATCPITIRAALLKVPGVSKAQVSYQKRRAVVSYDDGRRTQRNMPAAIIGTDSHWPIVRPNAR